MTGILLQRTLAGRHDPSARAGDPDRQALAGALRRDGEAETLADGPLAAAWTRGAPWTEGLLCRLDGRITNLDALRGQLALDENAGPEEIVAAGWARWGSELPGRLEGEFALLAWDSAARRGLLACDRLGVRGLFLHGSGRRTHFASEPRNLLALLPRRPAPDPVAVDAWLARAGAREGRTLYENIRRLEGGCLVELDARGAVPCRYWAPRYSRPAAMTRAHAVDGLAEAMSGAVARALPAPGAGQAAVLLSGGFDSGAVAALAAERGPATYSMTFPGHPDVDESARIAEVRDALGLRGVDATFAGGSALAAGLAFQAAWELPSVAPNWFVWEPLLRRCADDGFDVLLDGEGGDEVFGCSPHLVADRLRAGRALAALRLARALPGMGERPRPRWLGRALVRFGARGALPPGLHSALRSHRADTRHAPAWLRDEEIRRHAEHSDPWAWKHLDGPRWWAWLADTLTGAPNALGVPDQLRREYRLAGVEARHPFRDPQLIDFALALPPELAFDSRLDRPLAREALRGRLPDPVRLNTQKPFFNPILEGALDGPDRAAVQTLLADPAAEVGGYVKLEQVRELLDAPASGSARRLGWSLDVWRLLTLECWLRHQSDPTWSAAYGSQLTPSVDTR